MTWDSDRPTEKVALASTEGTLKDLYVESWLTQNEVKYQECRHEKYRVRVEAGHFVQGGGHF